MFQITQGARPGLQDLEGYQSMCHTNPVWRDLKTRVWNIFRYQDVAIILADYQTFSSDLSQILPSISWCL
jgi:hypothetical protein